MNNSYVLTVIVEVSPKTVVKELKTTISSVLSQLPSDTVQIIAVMEADRKNELETLLEPYKEQVEVVSEVSSCNIKGKYMNVLVAGEYWEKSSLTALVEELENENMEIIQASPEKNAKEAGIHYIQNEATEFMLDLAPIVFHAKYKEQVLAMMQEECINRLFGIASIYLQAERYLSMANIHVNYKQSILKPQKDWYTGKIEAFAIEARKLENTLFDTQTHYVQNILMNLFSACLKSKLHKKLSGEEQEAFLRYFKDCIMNMDDMIISKGGLNAALRMYVFELKYGKDVWNELKYRLGKIKFRNLIVFNLNNAFIIKKIQKTANGDQTEIRLTINNPLDQKFSYAIKDDLGGSYPLEKDIEVMEKAKTECFGKVLTKEVVYKASVPTSILDMMQYEYRCLNFYTGSMRMKEKV